MAQWLTEFTEFVKSVGPKIGQFLVDVATAVKDLIS